MKILVLAIGKTDEQWVQEALLKYSKRLKYYLSFEFEVIPDLKNTKNLSEMQQKEKEGALILKKLNPTDKVFLLDEKGKEYRSVEFAKHLQQQMNSGVKRLVFIIGGPYGFSPELYAKEQRKLALSKMTFSHQMIRPFFVEQLYRAITILKNEPYHHE
ncbi:MAG: 23S rRNA (pseudouridine(1915)-N(3))-methyltransferase RlmH [Flavobacteriales bacterium]|nr:23S rRNA (pseudouridine(1915)-N(3))-methyltransferase RlmH [Flavobacteriales bacterium]